MNSDPPSARGPKTTALGIFLLNPILGRSELTTGFWSSWHWLGANLVCCKAYLIAGLYWTLWIIYAWWREIELVLIVSPRILCLWRRYLYSSVHVPFIEILTPRYLSPWSISSRFKATGCSDWLYGWSRISPRFVNYCFELRSISFRVVPECILHKSKAALRSVEIASCHVE